MRVPWSLCSAHQFTTQKNKALFIRLNSIWEDTITFVGGGPSEYFAMNFRAKLILGLLKPIASVTNIKESCRVALEAAHNARDIIEKFCFDVSDADEEGKDMLIHGGEEAERTRLRWILSEEEILSLTVGGLSEYEAAFRSGALTWQRR